MTTRLRTVPTEFLPPDRFEVEPTHPTRQAVEARFAKLQSSLLDDLASGDEADVAREALQLAANQAAGLAWTTGYPLLVFPGLFAELAAKVECRAKRQKQIKGRSEMLLAAV